MIVGIPEYTGTVPDCFPSDPELYDIVYVSTVNKTYIYLSTGWTERPYDISSPDKFIPRDTLTRSAYMGRDYNTFVQEILAFIKSKFGESAYQDFTESDMGKVLFEAVAYVGDTLSWYQDFKASENFMLTANLRKNVARIAYQLAYKIGKASPAKALMTLTLPQTYAFDVIVPAGFSFKGGDLTFQLLEDVVFLAGATELAAGEASKAIVAEGETRTMSFISDGSANQSFELTEVPEGKELAQGMSTVLVDGAEWDEADFWSFDNLAEYIISYEQTPPMLKFGDQRVARVPLAGQVIQITFHYCSGSVGNVLAGAISRPVSPLIVFGQSIEVGCTNVARAEGGNDIESTEHVRSLAPRYFLTKDRAVSNPDIELLIQNFQSSTGSVADKVRSLVAYNCLQDSTLAALLELIVTGTIISREALRLAIVNYLDGFFSGGRDGNVIKLLVLMRDQSGNLTDPDVQYLTELIAYLNERRIPTVRFIGEENPTTILLRKADLTVYATSGAAYNRDVVKASISSAINTMFYNLEFGTSLRVSDIYAIIEAIPGVVWSNIILAPTVPLPGTGLTTPVIDLAGVTIDGVVKDEYGNLIINSDLLFVKGDNINISVDKQI